MPAADLPSPQDLSGDEVHETIDPNATGVVELSPVTAWQNTREEIEKRIAESDGEQRLIAVAELAKAIGETGGDLDQAQRLVNEVLAESNQKQWLHAKVEALSAQALMPWYLSGGDRLEHQSSMTNAIELYSHLGMDVHTAEMIIYRAFSDYMIEGGARRVAAEIWAARQLVVEPTDAEPRRHFCLGFASFVLGKIVWDCERDEDLAKRYWALAILHLRCSDMRHRISWVHNSLGLMAMEKKDFASAINHHLREALVLRHNEIYRRSEANARASQTTEVRAINHQQSVQRRVCGRDCPNRRRVVVGGDCQSRTAARNGGGYPGDSHTSQYEPVGSLSRVGYGRAITETPAGGNASSETNVRGSPRGSGPALQPDGRTAQAAEQG
jgi:hypothetical protein